MKKSNAILTLVILPLVLFSDAALGQLVTAGTVTPAVVESLYYSWIRKGEYVKARDRFDAWAKATPNAAPIRLAAARVDHLTGKYADALTHLDAVQNNIDVGLAARMEKAQVLIATGKRSEADVIYKKVIDDYQKGQLNRKQDQLFIALALWETDNFFDANETFKLIKRTDPQNAEAFVAWGDLLAYSTAPDLAVESYEDALAIDPNMPEALLGMARNLEEDEENSAEKAFKRAMEVNPNSIEGHLLDASHQLESE